MPQLIETIDRIARIQQRDVLYLSFYDRALKERLSQVPGDEKDSAHEQWIEHRQKAWKTFAIRQQIIDWLDAKRIAWEPCAGFAPGWITRGRYEGDIYLDLPYDKDLPLYQELEAYLQYPDDSMRFDHVMFFYLSLEEAMQNAEQDEPGFFDDM